MSTYLIPHPVLGAQDLVMKVMSFLSSWTQHPNELGVIGTPDRWEAYSVC